jgi:hypothetical protein
LPSAIDANCAKIAPLYEVVSLDLRRRIILRSLR